MVLCKLVGVFRTIEPPLVNWEIIHSYLSKYTFLERNWSLTTQLGLIHWIPTINEILIFKTTNYAVLHLICCLCFASLRKFFTTVPWVDFLPTLFLPFIIFLVDLYFKHIKNLCDIFFSLGTICSIFTYPRSKMKKFVITHQWFY